jgi:pimeloyl-ACP methyl ester carboxylesterase
MTSTISPLEGSITLPDGRNLNYGIYGDRDASNRTFFYHHGFPGTHAEAAALDEPARRRHVRLICINRPGMGGSTFQPDRRLLDWPKDLLAVADHLAVDRFAVIGTSGGGPYAMACYHQIPRSRCVGAGIIAGLWPGSLGLDGMLMQNKVLFWTAQWSTWLIEKAVNLSMGPALWDHEHPERLQQEIDKMYQNRPGPDRDAWNSNDLARVVLLDSFRQALRDGSRGMAWETYMLGSDWGFKLEDIKVEKGTLVTWHGELDVNVPCAMAKKAAVILDGMDLRVSPEDAHLSIVLNKPDEFVETVGNMF